MAEVQITNKLLKEAIADAETLVATAVENAKLSLEETFTPQIKSMIERKLRAEAEEVPHEDGEPEGSSEMPADSSEIGGGENKEPSDDAFDESDIGDGGENKEDSSTDWYDDWSESDFDLNEIIRELEEDVDMMSEKEDEEEEEDEKESEDEEESDKEDSEDEDEEDSEDEDEEDGEYPKGEPAGEEGEEPPADSSKIGEKNTAKFTLDEFLSLMQEAGYDMEEVFAPAQYVDAPATPPMEETKEEDLNLEEILNMLEAEDAQGVSEEMTSQVQELQQELAESRQAINILRGKLNEVNLLNAKLLFTNKIFRKPGISDEQKIMVVENFDRATTVREVKMVYAVLAESLKPTASTKAVKSQRKVVAEGLASKATRSTAPKQEIIAENSVAKRLQQLAGIIS
jgi:hypothetical protein